MIAIAALAPGRVIGLKGRLPWHYPEDLRFFKRTTLGHIVLMGRATFDSLGRRPLPGRENWVLSATLEEAPGFRVFRCLEQLPAPSPERSLFVIGGASVYAALLPHCRELLLTHIFQSYEGDTFFPYYDGEFEPVGELAKNPAFCIVRYRRREIARSQNPKGCPSLPASPYPAAP